MCHSVPSNKHLHCCLLHGGQLNEQGLPCKNLVLATKHLYTLLKQRRENSQHKANWNNRTRILTVSNQTWNIGEVLGSSCQVLESLSMSRYVEGLSLLSPSASSARKKWRTTCLHRWSFSLSTALCNCRFQSLSSGVGPPGTSFEATRGKSSSARAAAFPRTATCCPSVIASRTYTKSNNKGHKLLWLSNIHRNFSHDNKDKRFELNQLVQFYP